MCQCFQYFKRVFERDGKLKTPVTEELRRRISRDLTVDITMLLLCADPTRSVGKSYTTAKQPLGTGAFGSVFCAQSLATGEVRAVKQIPKAKVKDMSYVIIELEALVRLDHPNIAILYEFFEDSNVLYLVTELCSGGDFGELNHGIDDPGTIRLLYKDLLMGFAYCHELGVAHRDIKFENCLIHKIEGQRHVAKIIDFGLSAIRRATDIKGKWCTEQLGTCFFLAPEVVDTDIPYGVKCDCWSIGVLLYITLTDQHPCDKNAHKLEISQLFRKIRYNKIRLKPLETCGVSESQRELIMGLLVHDPEARLHARAALANPWFSGGDPGNVGKEASWKSPSALQRTGVGREGVDDEVFSRLTSFSQFSIFERAVLTLVAHQANSRDVEALRKAFVELDTSRTGTLSRDEVWAGFQRCGHATATEEVLDQVFGSLDAEGCGRIHYTQWLAATMEPSAIASDKAINQVTAFFDMDGQGTISREDLSQVLGDDEVSAVFARSNASADGCISYVEFGCMMKDIARSLEDRGSCTKKENGQLCKITCPSASMCIPSCAIKL